MLKHLIDRPVSVTMAMLVAVVLGLTGIRLLPVSLVPEVDIPYITVQVSDPALSAREMDEVVVRPLREQLIQVGGLEDIVTESRDGSGMLKLTFSHGADMDYLFIEVNEKIDRSMGSLPAIERPRVLRASATDLPAFFLNVTLRNEGGDFLRLSQFAEGVIVRRIEQLPEVAMVDVTGTMDEEILVLPDQGKLTQLGLTMRAFEAAIRSADIRLGSLTIRDGEYRYNVKFDARASSPEDIGAIWIRAGDRLLQVRDVASVSLQGAQRTGLARSDGKEAVTLAVIKQSDARMSDLKKGVAGLLDQFQTDYPELEFTLTRDQTRLLEYSIRNLLGSILLALILACVVIFLFMRDFRSPALVSLTMPLALVFSMLVFYLAGMSLNIVSLSGLLLGVGMMADNTIILVDNITARWQRDGDLRTAVLEGTKEVTGPMLSSVLTTCAVFIPLVFVSGIAGALFKDQALSVTIVLLSSYLVTITVIPVYYWWWYRNKSSFQVDALLERISFDAPLQRWDSRWMEWFLNHRSVAWGIVAVSVAGMALCLVFLRKERMPEMTRTETILKVDWNQRMDVPENEARVADLEAFVAQDVLQSTSLVGSQQFMLGHSGEQGITEASLYLSCRDQRTLEDVERRLSEWMTERYPDAVWTFGEAGNLFDMVFASTEAPLTARLRPSGIPETDLETLRPLIGRIREALPEVSIPTVRTKTDVLFIADPARMTLYGIGYEDLVSVLRNALNGNWLFTIVQGSRSLPVVTGTDLGDLTALLQETFVEKGGRRIPAMELLRQTYTEDLKAIVSGPEGNYYPLDFQASGQNVPGIMSVVSETVRSDRNYEVSYSGSYFSNRKLTREMLVILLVAITLLFLILASQFESLIQPVLILLEIVIDLFAALLLLALLGVSLNIMSLIGLVVVSGIVINDSILKIDTINRLHRSGMDLRQAVMTASSRRMKAILMTSLTTILAVVPFLARGSMGADLQYPMSLVIIAGMTVGTLVSLFLVPTLYYSVYHGRA
ncbi:MAG: efflux RND transporter permease subunit [Bacteroidales bacterium]|nr:efflux RND transporter permease subunit [Bacteroidales bacterium]